MRAVLVSPGGSPTLAEIPVPQPGAGQVLVRILAAAVNPVDAFTVAGGPREIGWAAPEAILAPGWDLAGEIVEAGGGVSVAAGTRVAAIVPDPTTGTFADYIVLPAADIAVVPAEVGTAQAAALPLAALTAAQALDLAGEATGTVPPGRLLITGAAGAVGGFAVRLAARQGWEITGLARDADRDAVLALGAAHAVTDIDGEYDVVLDAAVIGVSARAAVRDGGTYIGVVPDAVPETDRITASTVSVVPDGARLAGLFDLVAAGELTPRVRTTFPLDRVDDALAEAGRTGARGKVVLAVA